MQNCHDSTPMEFVIGRLTLPNLPSILKSGMLSPEEVNSYLDNSHVQKFDSAAHRDFDFVKAESLKNFTWAETSF